MGILPSPSPCAGCLTSTSLSSQLSSGDHASYPEERLDRPKQDHSRRPVLGTQSHLVLKSLCSSVFLDQIGYYFHFCSSRVFCLKKHFLGSSERTRETPLPSHQRDKGLCCGGGPVPLTPPPPGSPPRPTSLCTTPSARGTQHVCLSATQVSSTSNQSLQKRSLRGRVVECPT